MGSPLGARRFMFSAGVNGCISALTIVRCRASRLMAKLFSYQRVSYQRASYRAGQNTFCEEAIGFQSFVVNFAKSGNAVVPYQRGGGVTNTRNRPVVQIVDRSEPVMIVTVENIFFVF